VSASLRRFEAARSNPVQTSALLVVLLASASATPACQAELAWPDVPLALRAPLYEGFEKVADALQPSCGTLDCHGQKDRNLRLYGGRGLRLDPAATPSEGETQPAEYDADYWSVISLEPEVMAAVVADGGRDPERLILIRKGRETTRHKGGKLMSPGDDLDRCLLAWVAGNIDEAACWMASRLAAPDSSSM